MGHCARMISTVAITLALAFWAPYAGGQPVCPTGVTVTPVLSSQSPSPAAPGLVTEAWATYGEGCKIHVVLRLVSKYPVPKQCALVAHELGHSLFGLDHQPGTIMDGSSDSRPIPGVCYPKRRKHT